MMQFEKVIVLPWADAVAQILVIPSITQVQGGQA